MPHNHRGLPLRRYQVWTVLHHFDCRAADGRPRRRGFSIACIPNLCEIVLSLIEDLPCQGNVVRNIPPKSLAAEPYTFHLNHLPRGPDNVPCRAARRSAITLQKIGKSLKKERVSGVHTVHTW